MPKLNLIFGAGGIGKGSISHTWTTASETNELLTSLKSLNLIQLDSAAGSPPGAPWVTETLLGQSLASSKGFLIDTKILMSPLDPVEKAKLAAEGKGMGAGGLSEKNIAASLEKSRDLLGLKKGESVNVLYAHLPDPVTRVEESVRAFDKHLRAGDCKEVRFTSPHLPPCTH